MIRTSRERQEHHDAMTALFAQPDFTPVAVGAKVYTLTRMKRCPHCHSVFFGYERQGSEPQLSPEIDEDPADGLGMRGTCGNPICHENEIRRRMSFSRGYVAACETLSQPIAIPITRGGLRSLRNAS